MIQIEEMRIYILNTTRFYHEDFEEYPGAWFSCPVDFEEIRERLGVQSEEEIEIEDYELPFPLEGNTRLWEINALCRMGELSPCSPALIITFASDSPCRITYKSRRSEERRVGKEC